MPFPPGSSSDIVARIVAQGLSGKLGQPVVVENRPGASTAVGGEYVAHAAPDGYTLGLVNTSSTITQSLNPAQSFDVVKDFVPISMLGASPFVLASYPGVPAQTTQDLIALAKAEPGKHTFAEAGPATLANLAGVLFTKIANIQLTPSPIGALSRRCRISSPAASIPRSSPFRRPCRLSSKARCAP